MLVLVNRHWHRIDNARRHRHHGLAVHSCNGVEILALWLLLLRLWRRAWVRPLDLVHLVASILRLIAAAISHVVVIVLVTARLEASLVL